MLSRPRNSLALALIAPLAASLLLLGFWPRPATAQLLGPEFQVNSFTTGFQFEAAVAGDGSGNFVVVWAGDNQDGSYYGVFGQRFNATGFPAGSEFRANSYTTGRQWHPVVAAADLGSFVVVWASTNQDGSSSGVFGQRYSPAGSPVGSEFQVNSYTTDSQWLPAVAADGAGNFVVVWQSNGQEGAGYGYGVFGQRFDSAGMQVGSEFQVNTFTPGSQLNPAVAARGSGGFVVVWDSAGQDGSVDGVFGQRFSSAGNPAGSEFQVNSYTTGRQLYPAVAEDGSGNFVVAWQSSDQEGSGYRAFGQRFNSAGIPVGSEFRVSTFPPYYQRNVEVATAGSGDFIVAWEGYDGSHDGVCAQRFNSAGTRVGGAFQVNDYTTGYQSGPAVAAGSSRNFVVAWMSNGQDGSSQGVFGRQMNISIFADGFELADVCAWSAAVGSGDVCPP